MLFTNAYERAIDAKQRLPIPAEIRAALVQEGQSEALYLVEGSNTGLWLWPQRTFERMAGDIEPSLAPPAEVIDFDEITFPYAPRLEIDTAGRVRIPQETLEQAGIGAGALGPPHLARAPSPEERQPRRDHRASGSGAAGTGAEGGKIRPMSNADSAKERRREG